MLRGYVPLLLAHLLLAHLLLRHLLLAHLLLGHLLLWRGVHLLLRRGIVHLRTLVVTVHGRLLLLLLVLLLLVLLLLGILLGRLLETCVPLHLLPCGVTSLHAQRDLLRNIDLAHVSMQQPLPHLRLRGHLVHLMRLPSGVTVSRHTR